MNFKISFYPEKNIILIHIAYFFQYRELKVIQ